MISNLDSVVHEDLVPTFSLLSAGKQQEVFCLNEGICLHEDDSSRRVRLPIPTVFYSSDQEKLEERLKFLIKTFENRETPRQSRKGKAEWGERKKAKFTHKVSEPVLQVQTQCVPTGSDYSPPNVAGASTQSAPAKPSQKILPGCKDLRQVYARPSAHPSACVHEMPNRPNIEGQGRTNLGNNVKEITAHIDALQVM